MMVQSSDLGWVLIPFHHRHDLLRPLLRQLSSLSVLVVDDGEQKSDWSLWKEDHPKIHCVRAKGSSGFVSAVNYGLDYLESLNVTSVVLLNDDALISAEGILEILSNVSEKCLVSPVIQSDGVQYFGALIRRWGRVTMNVNKKIQPEALFGTCLGMPTSWRLDARFVHGFEDFDLSMRFQKEGGRLLILHHLCCTHQRGGTLDAHSPKGLQYSVRGHLQLFDSILKSPIILMTYYALILSRRSSAKERIHMIMGVHQGAGDWFCTAIAARMASSRAGSNRAKYRTTSR